MLACASWLGSVSADAQLAPGDVVVADFEAGPSGAGLLFLVDRTSGARTVLSDFGNAAQGPTGQSPFGVTVRDPETVLVVDGQGVGGAGVLFRVDGTTGARTILSDFGDPAQGPIGVEPVGIAPSPLGDLLVTDTKAGTDVGGSGDGNGAVFRVDPTSGRRTLLSDFGNPAAGALGRTPTGIARGASGRVFVVDPDAGSDVPNDGKNGGNGALFAVDPASGARTLVSDFGNPTQGPTGVNPGGVALGPNGFLLVADTEGGTGGTGVLFNVHPGSGMRTVLSTFGNMAQGPFGADPFFVAMAASGAILVSDDDAGTDIPLDGQVGGNGALFAVNQANGNRTLLSDFGNATQGPTGVNPVGVAIVPLTQPGDVLVIDFVAGSNGQGALFAVHPTAGTRTLLSDFGNALQGPQGSDPVGVAMGTAGDILVVDEDGVTTGAGLLFRVSPHDGARALVTDFAQGTQGPLGENPSAVGLEADGNLVVTDRTAGTGPRGAVFRVDPVTGARTLVSDFGDAADGVLANTPSGVVVEPGGTLVVADPEFVGDGALLRIDPATGVRTVLSDFTDATQGPTGRNPEDLTFDQDGSILVSDTTAGAGNKGTLFRVDPATGTRSVVTSFGDGAQGPTGQDPEGVAVRETGDVLAVDDVSGTNGSGRLYVVDATNGMRSVLSDFGLPGQGPTGVEPVDLTIFRDLGAPPAPLNAFLCFQVKASAGNRCTLDSPKPATVCETEEDCGGTDDVTDFCERFRKVVLPPRALQLVDQLERALYTVGKPISLCNPADVDGDDPSAPGDAHHLGPYQIGLVAKLCAAGSPSNAGGSCKREPDCGGVERQTSLCAKQPAHTPRTHVRIDDRFGTLRLDTKKPSRVLVPTAKSLVGPLPPPAPGLDHFTCYDVAVAAGTAKFPKGIQASVVDQFRQPALYDVVKPVRLCAPADADGTSAGAERHATHLACYQVKPAKGQPKHQKVRSIYTSNWLGPEVHDTIAAHELCVPAAKTLP